MRFLALVAMVGLSVPGVLRAAGEPVALPAVKLAPFAAVPALRGAPPAPAMAELPATLKGASNREAVLALLGVKLTQAQEQYLEKNRFLVVPKGLTKFKGQVRFPGAEPMHWDEMLGMHDEVSGDEDPTLRKPENTHLITPDVVLHAFHELLETSLEEIERVELAAALRRFVTGVRARLVGAVGAAPADAARLRTLGAMMLVPEAILETAAWERDTVNATPEKPLPEDDQDTLEAALAKLASFKAQVSADDLARASAELKLIFAAEQVTASPFFARYSKSEVAADYTQYRPRSHYAKSSALRAYFRAMMYLGRNSWFFETDQGLGDAVLMAWAMAGADASGKPLLDSWKRVMEVTGFFAGESDDVGYGELRDLVAGSLGPVGPALDAAAVARLRVKLPTLAPPRVISDAIGAPGVPGMTKEELAERTLGFRVFGQRFTFDAWMLGKLSAGREVVKPRLPGVPTAALVPAVFGDATARQLVDETLAMEQPPFDAEDTKSYMALLDRVSAEIRKVPDTAWYASVSAAWLKVLSRLTGTYGQGFPLYMTSPEFPLRQLGACLGSYAELKHDTLLYAKQNYAEYGSGGEDAAPPPPPRGLVEPNLPFWYELERLVAMYRAGVLAHKLLKGEEEEFSPTSRFASLVKFYTDIAEKQLTGKALTDQELERLRVEKLSVFAQPRSSLIYEDEQMRSALVADIHTDTVGQRVLYQATAEPQFMLVLISAGGPPRLAVGVVFDHREFTGKLDKRLSDQDWQALVYGKDGPTASRLRRPGPAPAR